MICLKPFVTKTKANNMTTKDSPLKNLKAQANQISIMLKRAQEGKRVKGWTAEKLAEARAKDTIQVGLVMDDKTIKMVIPWAVIGEHTVASLSEWIVMQMQEIKPN